MEGAAASKLLFKNLNGPPSPKVEKLVQYAHLQGPYGASRTTAYMQNASQMEIFAWECLDKTRTAIRIQNDEAYTGHVRTEAVDQMLSILLYCDTAAQVLKAILRENYVYWIWSPWMCEYDERYKVLHLRRRINREHGVRTDQ